MTLAAASGQREQADRSTRPSAAHHRADGGASARLAKASASAGGGAELAPAAHLVEATPNGGAISAKPETNGKISGSIPQSKAKREMIRPADGIDHAQEDATPVR